MDHCEKVRNWAVLVGVEVVIGMVMGYNYVLDQQTAWCYAPWDNIFQAFIWFWASRIGDEEGLVYNTV
jgi:hypothetical protein